MTTQEAADRLNLSIRTVQRYLRTGKMDYNWIGRRYDITEEQLARFIEDSTRRHKEMVAERR